MTDGGRRNTGGRANAQTQGLALVAEAPLGFRCLYTRYLRLAREANDNYEPYVRGQSGLVFLYLRICHATLGKMCKIHGGKSGKLDKPSRRGKPRKPGRLIKLVGG